MVHIKTWCTVIYLNNDDSWTILPLKKRCCLKSFSVLDDNPFSNAMRVEQNTIFWPAEPWRKNGGPTRSERSLRSASVRAPLYIYKRKHMLMWGQQQSSQADTIFIKTQDPKTYSKKAYLLNWTCPKWVSLSDTAALALLCRQEHHHCTRSVSICVTCYTRYTDHSMFMRTNHSAAEPVLSSLPTKQIINSLTQPQLH